MNYGPGDPSLAHTREEYVPVEQVRSTLAVMQAWLTDQSLAGARLRAEPEPSTPRARVRRDVWST